MKPNKATMPERDQAKSAEQQGLFRKFDVRRVDGSDAPGGKHHGCRYFVLDLDHDPHAAAAMAAYARSCEETHPDLSRDLRQSCRMGLSTWDGQMRDGAGHPLHALEFTTQDWLNHEMAQDAARYRALRAKVARVVCSTLTESVMIHVDQNQADEGCAGLDRLADQLVAKAGDAAWLAQADAARAEGFVPNERVAQVLANVSPELDDSEGGHYD